MRTNKTEKNFFFNKNERIFLVIEQRRYQLKHTKESKYLISGTNANTHTHRAHTHTHTRAFKICSVKRFLYSLNYKCVTIKTLFTQKWHGAFINEGKNYKCEVHVT